MLTKEQVEKLWERDGGCRSCGWYDCFYEVEDSIIPDIFDKSKQEEDGSFRVLCTQDSTHRGHKLWVNDLEGLI